MPCDRGFDLDNRGLLHIESARAYLARRRAGIDSSRRSSSSSSLPVSYKVRPSTVSTYFRASGMSLSVLSLGIMFLVAQGCNTAWDFAVMNW